MPSFVSTTKYAAYYMHLGTPKVVKMLRYRYDGKYIVYGFRCLTTGKVYIGSTMASVKRFHNHIITGENSNAELQAAIKGYGLNNFVAYVFETIPMPSHLTWAQKQAILHKVEQSYMDLYPKAQLFNSISSSAR